MDDDIRFILENAIRAPSGDNTQPWRFMVRNDLVEVWNRAPQDATSRLLDTSFFSSSIACGAVIENAVIAATALKCRTEVRLFPDASQPRLVAVLSFVKDAKIAADPLATAIPRRATDRKPYRRLALTRAERDALLTAASERAGGATLLLCEDPAVINALARNASLHDELVFSNRAVHDFLFSRITWTKRENARKRVGFYFPTLETPPFIWGAMQLLRHWWITKLGTFLSLQRAIAWEQRMVYRHAGAYGLVLSRGNELTDWVEAGRLIERVWLAATNLGLNVQPLTAPIFLSIGIEAGVSTGFFSAEERRRILDARHTIERVFDAKGSTLAFMFRVGHGKPPSARTSRLPIEETAHVEDSYPRTATETAV